LQPFARSHCRLVNIETAFLDDTGFEKDTFRLIKTQSLDADGTNFLQKIEAKYRGFRCVQSYQAPRHP
jgi:hypothetical protein